MFAKKRVPFILLAVFIGILMVNIDGMIVSTAMPTVIAKLGGMNLFSWVTAAYMLTTTVFIPIFGKLADLYGKKPFILLGLLLFTVASVLCATADSMTQLIWYRALQGVGGAPLMPLAFAMIFEIIPLEKRGRMQAMFMATNGIALVAGPQVGAWLTEKLSWHWVFLINVPFGIISMLLLALFYFESSSRKSSRLDLAGFTALTISITSLMLALVMGGVDYTWSSWQIILLFAVSVIFLVVFILAEKKASEPMIPLHLFSRTVVSSTGISFLLGLIMAAAMAYIPMYIQGVAGQSVSRAGNALTPLSVTLIFGSMAGSMLQSRLTFRTSMAVAIVLLGISCGMLYGLTPASSHGYVIAAMIVMGAGMGPLFPITMMLMQTSVSREHNSTATALVSFFRNIGLALGSSVFAAIINNRLVHTIQGLPAAKDMNAIQPQALMDTAARARIPAPILHVLEQGLNNGIIIVFAAGAAICMAMLALSLLAGKARLEIAPSDAKAVKPQVQQ
ncbi:DHA2 family efflux MFS transporter permease subunit [Paenibacillus sediminis]|uniref:EmrB/QacA subfamily drug resistance transporter n=1 Tax=Paenibacillus sediminis TaxID=664909 RepID=A0ABS4H423_9BACL|nr:DHA2 family efflux MFS transporter permease subunit [Paenibacillus sediminis]MBP1937206.1 EmrB/QacA subfamily drug resistance transporter [Paenibacillus sediminis]